MTVINDRQVQILVNAAVEKLPPDISESTSFLLNSLPTQQVAIALLGIWDNAKDEVVRSRAFDGLMKLRNFDTVACLINLYERATLTWQAVCTEQLGTQHDIRAAEKLCEIALTHSDADIRFGAVESLGKVGDASAIPVLQSIADNDRGTDYEGFTIREVAIGAIHQIEIRSMS